MRKIPLEYGEQLQFGGFYSHRLRRNKSNGCVSLERRNIRVGEREREGETREHKSQTA